MGSLVPWGGGVPSLFFHIASISNLLRAWNEFKRGKIKRKDVALFSLRSEDYLFALHKQLSTKTYTHDPYKSFYVCDPKRRHIHKANVKDRVVHQALFRVLYKIFDTHFIYDSYSSRLEKGTHKGVRRLYNACRKVSKNWKQTTYILKCDIRKFFDTIDHTLLRNLITQRICDTDTLWLIDVILNSFEKQKDKGLPLGNVTSQLFANIYLNELDQFAKHTLKAKHYFRYCDDFVIVHTNRELLEEMKEKIRAFLKEKLLLGLHPTKVEIRKLTQGVDFLGYVILPRTVILRTKTKKRMLRKLALARKKFKQGEITETTYYGTVDSYLGVLSHCRNRKTEVRVRRFLT